MFEPPLVDGVASEKGPVVLGGSLIAAVVECEVVCAFLWCTDPVRAMKAKLKADRPD